MSEAVAKKTGFLSWYFRINLLTRILAGLVLGVVFGCLLGLSPEYAEAFSNYTSFFGDLFVRLLKMIVVPVIFFSLITGAASITPKQLGRVGGKTFLYYLVTSVIAVAIALVLSNILKPGLGMDIAGNVSTAGKSVQAPSLVQVLLNIVPTNPIESLAKGEVLPIIFFALVFGIGLSVIRDSENKTLAGYADSLFQLCSICAETMYVVVRGIMQYAPIGIFVLISIVFAKQGPKAIGPLLFVTFVVYLGFLLHVIVGYGGLLALFGLKFTRFFKGAREASITAFVTRSSNATLPVTMRVAEENLGVPRPTASFALPIGATVNMDGTTVYLTVCAMFIGYATGQPLSLEQQFMVMITATLAAIGAAGVPGAGVIMLMMVLEAVGLNIVEGSAVAAVYSMILGIDALLDMGRTCLNVTGDITGAVVVSKSEKSLDETKWAS